MKIAIIGSGGAGMMAAWLLDGQHDVTLYERNKVLGGHAHTTVVERDGKHHYADDGFGWFSDVLYPKLMRLLEIVGIATRIVPMSLSFTQRPKARTLVLPPASARSMLKIVSAPSTVRDLLRLNSAIKLAEPAVHGRQRELSWGEFLDRNEFDSDFCNELLTPMVAGVWGGPYERVNDFSAYTLMKYLVFHRPSALSRYKWHVIRDGAASYIRAVAATLRGVTLLPETAVRKFEPLPDGWRLHDQHGVARDFDHVITTGGSRDTQNLIRDVPTLDEERDIIGRFEHYSVRLATHSDPATMPPNRADWQVANIMADGHRANLCVWTDAHRGSDVFTSYVGACEPNNPYNVSNFTLPLITPNHYRAQAALATIQGTRRIHFAGDWTNDIGCHEDAVVSAMRACQALDPALPRFAQLAAPRQYPMMSALPGTPA